MSPTTTKLTPFVLAAQCGNTTVCDLLINKNPSILQEEQAKHALTAAVYKGCDELVTYLIEIGVLKQDTGAIQGLLYKAAESGHESTVHLLAAKGATIGADAKLLYAAARGGLATICQEVLDAGTPVNEADNDGFTALFWAQDRLAMRKHDKDPKLREQYEATCGVLELYGGIATKQEPMIDWHYWKMVGGFKLLIYGVKLHNAYQTVTSCCRCPKKHKKQD